MSFERLLRRTWRENILFSALLELTYRCNLDCFFCYNDLSARGEPLSLARYLELLEELAEMQVLHLVLSGGEPLAHPEFFAIGARGRELGFAVRVKSNGHALRGALARRLKEEVDPLLVDLSLHGARAETHDRQTRVPGSFQRLMGNIPELLELGLPVKLNCTLTRWNEGEVREIFALADTLGAPLAMNPQVTPRDDGDASPLSIAPSREGILAYLRIADERAATARAADRRDGGGVEIAGPRGELELGGGDGERNCGAGASGVTVDPFGNVLPCVQWRRPLGNLHQQSLREIWQGAAVAGVREVNRAAGAMVQEMGEQGRGLAFCMGMSELATGDPLGTDPGARERQEALREHESGRASSLRVVR